MRTSDGKNYIHPSPPPLQLGMKICIAKSLACARGSDVMATGAPDGELSAPPKDVNDRPTLVTTPTCELSRRKSGGTGLSVALSTFYHFARASGRLHFLLGTVNDRPSYATFRRSIGILQAPFARPSRGPLFAAKRAALFATSTDRR